VTKSLGVLQIISIWGVVIPLVIGLLNFRKGEFQFRLFVFFLLAGFCTDITMYFVLVSSYSYYLGDILYCYSLIEACIFFWVCYHNASQKLLKRISLVLLISTPFLWLLLLIARSGLQNITPGQVFDPFYETCVAFLAGLIILQIVEQDYAIGRNPLFWILMGMFFYCFCTFFIMGFLNTLLSLKIWFLNNIINLITFVFYSIGLWKLRPRTQ